MNKERITIEVPKKEILLSDIIREYLPDGYVSFKNGNEFIMMPIEREQDFEVLKHFIQKKLWKEQEKIEDRQIKELKKSLSDGAKKNE